MSIDYKKTSNIIRAANVFIDMNINKDKITSGDIAAAMQAALVLFPVPPTEEETEFVRKELETQYAVYHNPGQSLLADYEDYPWYDDKKAEISPDFWSRYSNYLIDESGFSPNVVSVLGNETLDMKLMNFIGDPDSDVPFLKRGLIIGDVQSGKTSTYIGFMCKAADAGYRVFILLTGTIESLRKQTQERVEEGFVGIDMSADIRGGKRVGVGKDNKKIMARALTSRLADFNANTDKIAVTLGEYDTVVFVVKKQKDVLRNLRDWLISLNADVASKKIDIPMLLIDDEADNASINTKDKEDPTVINKLIRELADVFTRSNYVGFTATPFANIFIDPETTEEMETQDLFPEDFIVALPTPSNYIGPDKIFRKDGEHHKQLVYIEDAGRTEDDGWPFYFKHKKEWRDELPDSLTDALYTFYLANALRDLRGDSAAHRSMLINISRFVKVQKYIKTEIEELHKTAYTAIKFNISDNLQETLKDPVLRKIYYNWQKHYENKVEFSWDDVAKVLFTAIENIQIKVVNSSKSSEKLEYSKNTSLRVIAIGGLALSRGLTLEGLIVSYFYRNTNTYDVLMQMGRWFGYRKNYADLFRIWTHEDSARWYGEIAEATAQLKRDMEEMRDKKLKPRSFGIRVRNESNELNITSRNKMRATLEEYEYVGFSGGLFETPYISASAETNKNNFSHVTDLVTNSITAGHSMDLVRTKGAGEHHIIRGVSKSAVVELLNNIKISRYSAHFDTIQLRDFIFESDGLNKWDILFMDGMKSNKSYNLAGKEIYSVQRTNCKIDVALDKLSLGRRGKLGGPTDGMNGLGSTDIELARRKFETDYLQREKEEFTGTSYPSDTWFKYIREEDRNPMLIVYLLSLDISEGAGEAFMKELGDYPAVGFAIGFPANSNASVQKIKYRVSTKYNYFDLRENMEEIEEEE